MLLTGLFIVLSILFLSYVLYLVYGTKSVEKFESDDKKKEEDNEDYVHHASVIDAYNKVLDRNPTAKELFAQSKRLKDGDIELEDFVTELFTTNGAVLSKEAMIGDDAKNPAPSPAVSTVTKPTPALAPNGESQPDPTLALSKAAGTVPEVAVSDRASSSQGATANPSAPSAAKTAVTATLAAEAVLKERAAALESAAKAPAAATAPAVPAPAPAPLAATQPAAKTAPATTSKDGSVTTSANGTTIVFERPTIYNYYGVPPPNAAPAPPSTSASASTPNKVKDTNAGIPLAQTNAKTTSMIAEIAVNAGGKSVGVSAQAAVSSSKSGAAAVLNKDAAARELDRWDIDKQGAFNEERNMNALRYGCQRNTKYSNADDSMKLFPEFKWSVPQERAPVCMVPKGFAAATVSPLSEQTALIGTLLTEKQDMMITDLPLASDQKTGPRPAKK
jgi:hypothetical protein